MNDNNSSMEKLLQQLLEQNQSQGGKKKKPNSKELLHKLATEGRNLYHDRNATTYIEIDDKNQNVVDSTYLIPIESGEFDRWLTRQAYQKHQLYLDNHNLFKTIKILVSEEARVNGTFTEIHNRTRRSLHRFG